MNIYLKFAALTSLILLTGLAACHKSNDEPSAQKTDWLTIGAWRLSAASISPAVHIGTRTISDIFAEMEVCQKDDLITFNKDGNANTQDAGKRCSPSTNTSTTWKFAENETMLILDSQPMQILQLDASYLRLQQKVSTGKPDTMITFTYVRQ